MNKPPLVTSVSLPKEHAKLWREERMEIMRFCARYLRIQMRYKIRREVTRLYNRRAKSEFTIVTTRFKGEEYDKLHCVAATLRVSVSLLIYGLIKLWQKPTRRAMQRFFAINYAGITPIWNRTAGFLRERLVFSRIDPPIKPPPTKTLSTT